ncbi:hypothetical protein M951_chr291 (nucleomorph) [Lotharella oceanica]|uniref:Uncharacterized protein n=1 Tax=Lotharella oceanica TaxID=641309 RepID=A0A060DH04_9EUKA|nr:hypothetical protein M951_chr291 [Lotharella oceanica]
MIPNFFIFKILINNYKDEIFVNKNYKSIFGFINGITIFLILCKICRYYPFSCTLFLFYYVIKYFFQKNIYGIVFLKYSSCFDNIKKKNLKFYFKKTRVFKCLTPSREFFITSYNLSFQQLAILVLLFIQCLFHNLVFIKIQNFIINRIFSLNYNILQVFYILFLDTSF